MILSVSAIKTLVAYLGLSLFCGIFGAGYEHFSHGVYSNDMVYLFAFPLVGGAIPYALILLLRARVPGRVSANLYHSGIATLTVGSCLSGVLQIYGTASQNLAAYWWVGYALAGCGALAYLLPLRGMIAKKE